MLLSHEEFSALLDDLKRNVVPSEPTQIDDFRETLDALYKCARHAEALIAFAELTALLARSNGHRMDSLATLATLYGDETRKLVTQLKIAENRSQGKGQL